MVTRTPKRKAYSQFHISFREKVVECSIENLGDRPTLVIERPQV